MMNVGYQESDSYSRSDRNLLKATDANVDEELEPAKADSDQSGSVVSRVEYDMDEQDDMWLEKLNTQRKATGVVPVTREIFEITMTKIEKEWHALEKRIPKPNPKPPQTHRPRSSSAAAVNGEPQAGEEQDSKCAICDDGDCENTNAIVFCDGCDLAVHQECYGVPFIPEGQWLCRKCQLIGRGIPVSIESQFLDSKQRMMLTMLHYRLAYFAPTRMVHSSRLTHLNGLTCSALCGFPKSLWETIPSWNRSWRLKRSRGIAGSSHAISATSVWELAYSVATRTAT
jgi:hypothetical protein